MVLLGALLVSAGMGADPAAAAKGVIERTFPKIASRVSFRVVDRAPAGGDWYRATARNGRLEVSGTSGVALCRGTYDYVKAQLNGIVQWEGTRYDSPGRLPDWSSGVVSTPHQYRHYFNVCTFGYTTAFWDWNRWRREIDWMALHGINMPLAMTGQEAVWQKVWRSEGLSDEQIREFFGGPAYLPWHRMGNIDAHMGPLPQSWIDNQAALQKQILAAERELGMKPVVPAFSGFVPTGYAKANPDLQVILSSNWAGFAPTVLLSPEEPKFRDIGEKFVREYRAMFGSDHLYLADVFNEMTPRVEEGKDLEQLRSMGAAVFDAIQAGDPDAVWVMQGWLFLNEAHFWTEPRIDAFLSGVPNERMVLLDLAGDIVEIWRKSEAFRDRPWIWNVLHNFGQRTAIFGKPRQYVDRWQAAVTDPESRNMVGMGLTPEGIEQNSLIYELVTDLMWSKPGVSYDEWLADYCRNRYGIDDPALAACWDAFFNHPVTGAWQKIPLQIRPGHEGAAEPDDAYRTLIPAVEAFLALSPRLADNPLYQRDAVDFTKAIAGHATGILLFEAQAAIEENDRPRFDHAVEKIREAAHSISTLLATQPAYRLSNWVQESRTWGLNPAEKDLMEANAKMQVTAWGGPVLYDYAAKEWSGLVDAFYAERWIRALTAQWPGAAPFDMPAWELEWANSVGSPATSYESVDPVEFSKELLQKFGSLAAPPVDKGIAVGKRAFDSGHTESGGDPGHAVDGAASGKFWAASPAPQWWAVDLGESTTIDQIHVYFYADGTRFYQYRVEISLDGENWELVADESGNRTPSSRRGERHAFPAQSARFVRVTVLSNSANVGVHLHEVRVFAPGPR